MITIKRRSLALMLAVALVFGAAAAAMGIRVLFSPEIQRMYDKYSKLEQLSKFVEANYYQEVASDDLLTGTYKGLFFGLDDMYSYYMTAEEYEALNESLSGEYQGIGITFTYNEQNNLVIISTADGSPAKAAGLLSGDAILMVDDIPYTAAEMNEAGAHMRGKPGTDVKLTILREGETKEYVITRANILNPSVRSEMLDGGIAYVRVSKFDANTAEEFQKELHAIELRGAKGMVIDLRDNGGGLVEAGERIADMLLPECVIVHMVDNAGVTRSAESGSHATDMPYALLVNGGTASTSEILAAAVQDNGGGKIVGTRTFGKGVVQTVIPLNDGSGDAVQLTTSQYLSPNGNVIHKKGVEPDFEVELVPGDDRDYQLEKAVELLD